jgi:hypothetical protein
VKAWAQVISTRPHAHKFATSATKRARCNDWP